MRELDAETIRHALETARENGFRVVKLQADETKFRAVLGKPARKAAAANLQALIEIAEPTEADGIELLTAGLVGYFRETAEPFQVGRTIERGEVVASISALGLANDVASNVSGEILEVLVETGQPVAYGQVLAKVKTA